MAFLIERDEATAGRRFVPFRLFNSDGTGPFTSGSNITMLASLNGAAQLSLGSVSVVSATAGMYGMQLTQSNCSTLGSLALYTDNAAHYAQHVATVQVVNNNPFSTHSGVIIAGGSYSSTTVRLDLVAYSGATVGAGNFTPGVYSGVSFSNVSSVAYLARRAASVGAAMRGPRGGCVRGCSTALRSAGFLLPAVRLAEPGQVFGQQLLQRRGVEVVGRPVPRQAGVNHVDLQDVVRERDGSVLPTQRPGHRLPLRLGPEVCSAPRCVV